MAYSRSFRFIRPLMKVVPIAASAFSMKVFAQEHGIPVEGIGRFRVDFDDMMLKVDRIIHPAPVPILHIAEIQNKIENTTKIRIDVKPLYSVLDKIGNRPFAIYSLNGPARTGKSFLLDKCVHYLKSSKSEDWLNLALEDTAEKTFKWRNATARCTTGINIWPEPLEISCEDGSSLPVILLDCQGAFDEKTSTQQNAIIFAISALLSSVLIFNIQNKIDESTIQFLDHFAQCAKLSGETTGFQKLIILVRDFEFGDFKHGYYSGSMSPEGEPNNFKTLKIDPTTEQASEAQECRMNIISSFDEVAAYLMPHPGKNLQRHDSTDDLDQEFQFHLQQFIELTLDPKRICTKKIGGKEITGTEFKEYVQKWSDLDWTKNVPSQSIRAVNEELQYTQARSQAVKNYSDSMDQVLAGQYQVGQVVLVSKHEKAVEVATASYRNAPKLGGSKNDDRFGKEFKDECDQLVKKYSDHNSSKPLNTILAQMFDYAKYVVLTISGYNFIKSWIYGN